MAILIDDPMASSGEAALICFRGLDYVRVFGGPTAGYASANQPFPLPDIITALRFLGGACLLLCNPADAAFWVIYGLCGVTDIADGYLTRKLHAESKKRTLHF